MGIFGKSQVRHPNAFDIYSQDRWPWWYDAGTLLCNRQKVIRLPWPVWMAGMRIYCWLFGHYLAYDNGCERCGLGT